MMAQWEKMRPEAVQTQSNPQEGTWEKKGSASREFDWFLSGQREHHEQRLGGKEAHRKGTV